MSSKPSENSDFTTKLNNKIEALSRAENLVGNIETTLIPPKEETLENNKILEKLLKLTQSNYQEIVSIKKELQEIKMLINNNGKV